MLARTVTIFVSIAMLAVSLTLAPARADGQNLIANGSFNANVDGWTLPGGEAETSIAWDGGNGSPSPGSLRMTSTLTPVQGRNVEAVSSCVATIPDEILTVSGRVLKPGTDAGLTCYTTLALYGGIDCTGNRLITLNFPPNTPGVWEDSGIVFPAPVVYQSARVSLTMELNGPDMGEKVCLFDTVSMTSDSRGAPISDIPVLSWPGIVVLSLLMTATATALLIVGRSGPVK